MAGPGADTLVDTADDVERGHETHEYDAVGLRTRTDLFSAGAGHAAYAEYDLSH